MEARKPMFPNKTDPRRQGSKDGSSFQSSDDMTVKLFTVFDPTTKFGKLLEIVLSIFLYLKGRLLKN